MEASRQRKLKGVTPEFDVVVERKLGTVVAGNGEHNPVEAAMLIIATSGEEGDFKFTVPAEMFNPGQGAFTAHVTVAYESQD
jgi:hypothetical protein